MSDVLRCKGCQAALRLRPEYAGKKLRCPRCKNLINVPALHESPVRPDDPPLLPSDSYATTTSTPDPIEEVTEIPRRASGADENLDELDEEDDYPWVACPSCGARESERVLWTWWGSFYGPAMFNHVECGACGKTYNGYTGRSNFIPALIFVTIPMLLIMGLVAVITWIILTRQFN